MARTHGLVSTYKNGCRCDDCTEGSRLYDAELKRRRRRGLPTTDQIDAEPVRAHIRALRASGKTLKWISKQTGVMHISYILYGSPGKGMAPQKRISAGIARRIMAIPAVLEPTTAPVCADPARRMVEALRWLGYSVHWQARTAGVPRDVLTRVLSRQVSKIQARYMVAIRDLCDEYWNKPAPEDRWSKGVRTVAIRNGCLPLMAWDDDLLWVPDEDLPAELSRRAEAMDTAELVRCYKAAGEGDRSPLIVAGAARYLEVRRIRRKAAA
jgi:lambda repressor-like predicted transcriptional regulator